MRDIRLAAALCAFALPACDASPELNEPPLESIEAPLMEVDLRAALSAADVDPVGITVDPDNGRRFLLDAGLGLYELDAEGRLSLLLAMEDFPAPDVPLRSGFTDLASLGNNRFALTARSFGYLLDLEARTLTQFFCYVPPMMDDDLYDQSTHTVALDPSTGVLYSQPQTLEVAMLGMETVVASQVGMFDAIEGLDLSWYDLPDVNFLAGGLAVQDDGSLLLGADGTVFTWSPGDEAPVPRWDLGASGVRSVQGMAWDGRVDSLFLLDGQTDRLLELKL